MDKHQIEAVEKQASEFFDLFCLAGDKELFINNVLIYSKNWFNADCRDDFSKRNSEIADLHNVIPEVLNPHMQDVPFELDEIKSEFLRTFG